MAPAEPAREAQERNEQLVSHLERTGALRDPAVGAAFRAVLRHHFLPGRPLDEVYEDAAIMTKVGDGGLPVSSSSQPAIMAIMLQLLQLLPGHRVLEVGAGTGYNAALMAHLVGPDGRVVTVDIDEELAGQARAHLAEAGVEGVEVVHADGAAGWLEGAPYDRIIVTASVDDVAPAWPAQLVEEGRLVLPLALASMPAQHCVALVKHGQALVSSEVCPCGFMPLRGTMAANRATPDERIARWLAETPRAADYSVPATDFQAGFATWLTLRHGASIVGGRRAEGTSGLGLRDERGLALVSDLAEEGRHPVLVYGAGEDLAERLIEAHRAWTRQRGGPDQLRIAAYPSGQAPDPRPGGRALQRPHYTFLVSV